MNITEVHRKAERAIGAPIDWDGDGVRGFCACPAEAMHTHKTGKRDCTIYIEGAPTLYCFHSSCKSGVEAVNRKLRRALGGADWAVTMPDGSTLRSGEARLEAGASIPPPKMEDSERKARRQLLESIGLHIKAGRGQQILDEYKWTTEQMVYSSPIDLEDGESFPEDFNHMMRLWHPDDVVWCGDTMDSGQPHHMTTNFKRAGDWLKEGVPRGGQFTCPSAFGVGTFSRSAQNVTRRRFLVVESDTLNRETIGAVFQFMRRAMSHALFAVVDTGGKSLHGWLSPQNSPQLLEELKATLTALGCDPALFGVSQPVRLAGVPRNAEANQVLLWCASGRAGQ